MATVKAIPALTSNPQNSGHRISVSSPVRPTSAHTLNSTFADSAVDMETPTPTETPDLESKVGEIGSVEDIPPIEADVDQSLSDKMRQLAAVAWTLEQDDDMPAIKRRSLHELLEAFETHLDSQDEQETVQDGSTIRRDHESASFKQEQPEEDEVWIDESDLISVRESLAATLKAMRMRHEEQSHLHQLTSLKLEAVAQRCIEHEERTKTLLTDLRRIEEENRLLQEENEKLREKSTWLENEASRNEVAVEAMSSAVAGLEGWIESTHPSRAQTPIQSSMTKRQRVVVRGKGRFRGRYYVDEDGDAAVAYGMADAAAESQELHDGVKAWLRGFRDVEEELRHHESPPRTRRHGKSHLSAHQDVDDDEWGDFQSPARYH